MEENISKLGIVYILTNLAMPGYVKIGITSGSIEQRIRELSGPSSVPIPFECFYAGQVNNIKEVEGGLHDAFGDHRVNPKREFFKIAPERVVAVLRLLSIKEVTPTLNTGIDSDEDKESLEVARKRRSAFNFRLVQIAPGSELKFLRNEEITCQVDIDQKHVVFNDRQMSLSEAAKEALGYKWQVQGPAYWTYNGEILDEIRQKFEENSEALDDHYEAIKAESAS